MHTTTIRSRAGFTLIEIAFVLLIAAVVLSMTFVAFGTFSSRAAARGSAQTFAADLRLVRAFSLRSRGPVTVQFKEDSALYRVYVVGGDTLESRYFNGQGEFRVDSLNLQLTGDSLRFDGDGTTDDLSGSTGTALFSAGGLTYSVTFNASGASTVAPVSN